MDMDKFEKFGEKCVGYMLAFCLGFCVMNAAEASEFDRQESYYGVKVEMILGGPSHGEVKWRPFKGNLNIEGYKPAKKLWEPVKDSEVAKFKTDKAAKALLERMGVDL